MHGTVYANYAIMDSDYLFVLVQGLMISCGKIDDFAKDAKIIHIDIDPSSIGKNIDTTYPL